MREIAILALLFIGLLLPAWWLKTKPASAGISVTAESFHVQDGDTIHLFPKDGRVVKVRMWGINAPELRERCNGSLVGQEAREHLKQIIGKGPVLCTQVQNQTSYDRIVAICKAGDLELGWAMVKDGYAFDWPYYSQGWYKLAQVEAERNGNGLWGLTCD